jgi:hypothetical protein
MPPRGGKSIPLGNLCYIAREFPSGSNGLHAWITGEWAAKPPPEVRYIANTSTCKTGHFHGFVTAGMLERCSRGGTFRASAIYTYI